MEINQRMKELRLEQKLNIKEVAQYVGLVPTAIYNYELGIREPSIATIKKLCKLFNVTSDYLIGLTDD